MSYFALIPKEEALQSGYNPITSTRSSWMGLNAFDKIVCDHFKVEVDPKYYCKGWKDLLYLSQSESSKGFIGTYSKFYIYDSPEQYRKLCALHSSTISDKHTMEDCINKIKDSYESYEIVAQILTILYNMDYVLVGVFNED